MRLKRILIVLVLCTLLFSASCTKQRPVDSILQANRTERLLQKNNRIEINLSYANMPDYDDVTYSMYARKIDDEIEITDFTVPDNIIRYVNNTMYMLEDSLVFYTVAMSGYLYSMYISPYIEQQDIYYSDANYKLTDSYKKDGLHTYIYAFEINDVLIDTFYLWNLKKGERIIATYVTDSKFQILTCTYEKEVMGGGDLLLLKREHLYNENNALIELMDNLMYHVDTVTVTIHDPDNGEAVKKYDIPTHSRFGYDFSDDPHDIYYDDMLLDRYRFNDGFIDSDIDLYIGRVFE